MSENADNRDENPIDGATAGLIRRKAGQIVRTARLSPSDREDVTQDLTIDILNRLQRFDPGKSARDVFVRMILNHAAADLLRRFRARAATTPCALDRDHPDPESLVGDLAREVTDLVAGLPEDLRRLAELLSARHTTKEAAETLGVSLSTVSRRRRELRAVFERAGFRKRL